MKGIKEYLSDIETNEEIIDESTIDPAMGWTIIAQFMATASILCGLLLNVREYSIDGTSVIDDIKKWWKDKKANKIIKRLAKDPEIQDFLSDSKEKKGWRKLLKTKLSEEELKYLTRITKNKVKDKL